MSEATPPKLLIVGGSNGAGKSTFAVPYAAQLGVPFLNADVLTKRYADAGETQPLIKAAREFMRVLDEAIERGESVCIETTLSGRYIRGVVERAKSRGFRVELFFLFLTGPEIAVRRVAARVDKGGHDVPAEDIRRRFDRTFDNFHALRDEVDLYEIYLAGNGNPQLVAKRVDEESTIFMRDAYALFLQLSNRS